MTSNTRQRLRVDLADWEGNTAYAEYDNFTVGSELTKYRLVSLGEYNGTAGQYDVKTRIVMRCKLRRDNILTLNSYVKYILIAH